MILAYGLTKKYLEKNHAFQLSLMSKYPSLLVKLFSAWRCSNCTLELVVC